MSKLETNTIDTISGSTTLTLGGTNATTIAQDSATTVTGFKSTGIDDNATANALTIDSSSNLQFNSGYGSVATAYGVRAWVNFNGSRTVAIRESGNVTSITDNGIGNYTLSFTTAMPDANYSVVAIGGFDTDTANQATFYLRDSATGSVRIRGTAGNTLAFTDFPKNCVAVFR